MIMPQADTPTVGFRPFFNPATGEWITYTATAEDSAGQLVRFTWRSVPGGVITEHIHPRQEERFTILAGEAHFTLNGQERVAGAGETVVVPAGVPHSEGNPGPGEIEGIVELRPALQAKEWHEALAGLVADGKTTPRGAPRNPPARRHLLALPPRKPDHLTAHLDAEPHAPPAVGTGQDLRHPPLLPALGQPDRRS
jgi:quercetin dioxygenase-like cupin family protein